jgi:cephalosporin-C deacetylase-like acetyl esterase/lysophospholipase L1-like esterase
MIALSRTLLLSLVWLPVIAWGQALHFEPFKPGSIYRLGEHAGWNVTAPAGSQNTKYAYTVKKNDFTAIQSGTLDVSRSATIDVVVDEPAMLYVEVRPSSDPAATPQVVGAAIAPLQLRSTEPEPPDFDRFWASKIRMLQKVPMHPVLTQKPSGHDGIEYYTFTMDHIEGRHIHGQLAKPVGKGPFPGLAIFQWASPPYPLQKEWVTDRAAEGWLAVNIEPHDVLPDAPKEYYDALPQELKEYQSTGRNDRDKNYFLQMYLADYRAIEYLASRPEWNRKTLVVNGTSMGGQQSLCAAAFNHRVTALVVHVPAGADASAVLHGRSSGYPNWPVEDPAVRKTAQYFDSANCASRVTVPSLVSMGFKDTTTPPAGIWIAFNRIRGPKEVVPLPDAAHNHLSTPEQQAAYTDEAADWLRTLRVGAKVFERADQPSPRHDANSMLAHRQLIEKKTKGRIDVYFLGDSITRRWGATDEQYRDLYANWKQNFFGWNAADFGWGGDKTQNILWRLDQGELDGVNPKVIVLMAGTNNVGKVTPVDVAARVADTSRGIEAIVARCRKKAPRATLILMGITPRNDNVAVMPIIDGVNANIARLANGSTIRYVNINSQLADPDGKLHPGMTDPDHLHLRPPAYQIWADALAPILTELLGPRAAEDHAPPPTGDPSAVTKH